MRPTAFRVGRPLALRMLGAVGALTGYRPRWERGGLTVFVFHNVTKQPSPFESRHRIALSPHAFARSIEWIARHYDVIGPRDLSRRGNSRVRAALLTCDDGFLGALTDAAGLLDQLSMPAVFFLNMGVIRGETNVAAEAELLAGIPVVAAAWPTGFALPAGVAPDRLRVARELADGHLTRDRVLDYQGRYAGVEELRFWDRHPRFSYANHLWNHWSTQALQPQELGEQYRINEAALRDFTSHIPWFSATSGGIAPVQLGTFSELGAERVLAGRGGPNRDPAAYLLHRVDLAGVGGSVSIRGATILASAVGGRRSGVPG